MNTRKITEAVGILSHRIDDGRPTVIPTGATVTYLNDTPDGGVRVNWDGRLYKIDREALQETEKPDVTGGPGRWSLPDD
jgi:hypothetical protein